MTTVTDNVYHGDPGLVLDKTLISCGVYQLKGVGPRTPAKILTGVFAKLSNQEVTQAAGWCSANPKPRFIIFSDVINYSSDYYGKNLPNKGGAALAKYIVEKGYGQVTESPSAVNPSLHNTIAVWIWTLNWDTIPVKFKKKEIVG